jgi:hypothetical protein
MNAVFPAVYNGFFEMEWKKFQRSWLDQDTVFTAVHHG